MRILHFYHQESDLQAHYVALLMQTMAGSVEVQALSSLTEVRKALDTQHFDILHIHGCWSIQYAKAATQAHRLGTRVVISPHGELEPWILKNRQWQEKMPKTLLYQRQTIQEAYVVIAMGSMERESLEKLGWNPRIETIRNAVITHSITPSEMTRQLLTVYQKVMDSDVFNLMSQQARDALFLLLKAAVSGNPHWLQGQTVPQLTAEEWRQLLKEPMTDVSQVQSYFPTGYQPVRTITETIGNKFATENDRLLATFKYLHRLNTSEHLAMAHLLELDREIREHDIDEELLKDTLEDARLLTFASRLMGVLESLTQLEEGLMPVPAIHDRQTEKMEDIITNHLKI